jgi:hypothetical protein
MRRYSRPQTRVSDPEFDAALLIAITNMLYLIGILGIISAFSNSLFDTFFKNIGETKIYGMLFALGFFLLHEYFYVWNGNSKNIIKEFKNINIKKADSAAVIFYMWFAYVFVIASGLLFMPAVQAYLPHF